MSPNKIMVVDDNASTRRMVRAALQRNGHTVIEAADGKTARALMQSERPRIILQDLMLPDVDGFELVGELRKLAQSDVTILAFSGLVSKLDESRLSSVGFDDVITKPIAPSRLVPLIEAHLPVVVATEECFGTGRYLVVADDDPLQLKLAAFRLGRLGFVIDTVPDGKAALDAIRRRRPDVVVSDVMMPELDGFGLAMAVRQDPDLRTVPVVLVTSSYVDPSDRELARRAGAEDLVVRTPELTELIEHLRLTVSRDRAPPTLEPESLPELEREHSQRVLRQLERQVMLNSGLAKRCSSLASELMVLSGIAESVLKRRDIGVALDEAIGTCFDAGGVSVGALYLRGSSGALEVRSVGPDPGWAPHDLSTFFGHETLLLKVISTGAPLYLPSTEVASEVTADVLARCAASSVLLVPLASAEGPLGALLMVARDREVNEGDWRGFANGVATQISQVLTLARAYADREAAELKAANHAALLEAVVESAPDYVIQVDLEGRIGFMNHAGPPLEPGDQIGELWTARMSPEHREAALRAFRSVVETGMPSGFEIQSGTNWFQGRLGPVRRDGKTVGCVVISRDVTEKKHTEMQLMLADRMASVGTLAAGVAHEINNPLASVIANLDMAQQDVADLATSGVVLPRDLTEELVDARSSADRVREIVRDLKIFSRADEDKRRAIDVEKVLESTLRMAWNEVRHRARVIKHFAKVPRVDANESRIGQVFLNLIVNAVQAIPEGNYEGNQIKVTTALEGDRVVVTIADSGTGIPVDVQARLFTPFFTTKPVGVGTGLGLAISHRIITSLGGEITFVSALGKGTTFRVALPLADAALPAMTQRIPVATVAKRRGRVLIIDDEESLGHALRRFLSQDHDVTAVTSARFALESFAAGIRYDVILCDLMMPQITGMELFEEVTRLDPVQAAKIVFMTGGAFTLLARQFLDTTPNRRIEKPFDLKGLRHLVNSLID